MRKTSVDLEERQFELVASMSDNGDAATQSEAIRDAIEHYAQARGYVNGAKRDTRLRWLFRQMGWAFMLVGLGAVGVFYFFPVNFRIVAVVPLLSGLIFLATDRALERHEPRVSNRLREAFTRGERA